MIPKQSSSLTVPPVKPGDYLKLFDHNEQMIHEGKLAMAPGQAEAFRADGGGLWSYFFEGAPEGGVTVGTPHKGQLTDQTSYRVKADTCVVHWSEELLY